MVFSSLVFLSMFLPVVLLLYWLLPSITGKNILLLTASLFFYAYGEPVYVFLMAGSSFFHYVRYGSAKAGNGAAPFWQP